MRKFETQQKNYTEFDGYYQLVLPLDFEKIIPEDDSVRLLSHITEELNYEKLYKAYTPTWGENLRSSLKSYSRYLHMLMLKVSIQPGKLKLLAIEM
ncbi:Predicted transposase [Clostridium kluyveri DSM 555]|uniref:Predicted transposase n=1 Tax=Clostridium kluyveri (strain ATCC 8527 / DSM 555 / NBRC 12016 / NCIMB 10680 / K1) TaxID=431943 RepID=A5N5R9_CLOK5|nr:Predicted transposase [Clostridium kluyveri DSM 555]